MEDKHRGSGLDTETRLAEPVRTRLFTRRRTLLAAAVAASAGLLYLLPVLIGRPIAAPPEARIAAVAREMVQSHDYIAPTLGGKLRLINPPLPYWQAALAAEATADGELSAAAMSRAVQLPSALMAALGVFIIVLYGCAREVAGIGAGLLLAFSALPAYFAESGPAT